MLIFMLKCPFSSVVVLVLTDGAFVFHHGLKRQKSGTRVGVADCSFPSKHTISWLWQLQCLWARSVERTGWTGNTADQPRDTRPVCLPAKLTLTNPNPLLCEITENLANKTNQSEAERGGAWEDSGQQWSWGWGRTAGQRGRRLPFVHQII